MKRIVIALIATLGFAGGAFADVNLTSQNPIAGFSKVEATSYVASLSDLGQYQVFNP